MDVLVSWTMDKHGQAWAPKAGGDGGTRPPHRAGKKCWPAWRRQSQTPAPRLLTETFNRGGNGEPLADGRIWSGPLKLLLPALRPRSREISGGRPLKIMIFQQLFLDMYKNLACYDFFKIKWPITEEKMNFGGRWVWAPMKTSPPPNKSSWRRPWGQGQSSCLPSYFEVTLPMSFRTEKNTGDQSQILTKFQRHENVCMNTATHSYFTHWNAEMRKSVAPTSALAFTWSNR